MTDSIKRSLKERSKLSKYYYKNGQKKSDYKKLLEKSSDCTKDIFEAKSNFILKMTTKLQDAKTHWAILSFYIKCLWFLWKETQLLNIFLAPICTPIKKSSVLLLFSYRTNARITWFDFTEEDMSLITKSLDPAKAHGCDNISKFVVSH